MKCSEVDMSGTKDLFGHLDLTFIDLRFLFHSFRIFNHFRLPFNHIYFQTLHRVSVTLLKR
jgi:hypothetical protein